MKEHLHVFTQAKTKVNILLKDYVHPNTKYVLDQIRLVRVVIFFSNRHQEHSKTPYDNNYVKNNTIVDNVVILNKQMLRVLNITIRSGEMRNSLS